MRFLSWRRFVGVVFAFLRSSPWSPFQGLRGARTAESEAPGVEADFTFEEPWEPVTHADFLLQQIQAELTPPHPLFGQPLTPLAIRADSDDVLVSTGQGYAMVHLSWCRRRQPSPDFPHTVLLADWETFLDRIYEPDVSAWLEENPSDEWDALIDEATGPPR